MKILITGSNGRIGKLIVNYLKKFKKHELILLDRNNRKNSIDILQENITSYFKEVDIVIHLAANPNPTIGKKEATKNVEIVKNIIKACNNSNNLKIIINASSINVYPYIKIFNENGRITKNTKLSPNTTWSKGRYGKAKIDSEKIFERYCNKRKINLLNLRLGSVTEDDKFPKQEDGSIDPVDKEILLKHKDLLKIIKKGLRYKGIGSYVCVSKEGFIDKNIKF